LVTPERNGSQDRQIRTLTYAGSNGPFAFYLDVNSQIGTACSVLKEVIRDFKAEANRRVWPKRVGTLVKQRLAAVPLLLNIPDSRHLPTGRAKEPLARQVKTAMWIAWAKAQE
jgi:hypothetical protein